MSSGLQGKVCVITGTGGSIGRASALVFAREGALVVGWDLSDDAVRAMRVDVLFNLAVDGGTKVW